MTTAPSATSVWRFFGWLALTAVIVGLAKVVPGEVWHAVLN